MAVVVLSTKSNHTHYRYFDYYQNLFGIVTPGCCGKQNNSLYCTELNNFVDLISSCSWINDDETFGVVFATTNQSFQVPLSVVGALVQDHYPFVTLPNSQYSCTLCSSQCQSYNITEQDITDFIKTHALARSFLEYTKSLLPNWIDVSVNKLVDSWYDDRFDSYELIADVIQGKDVNLIDGCENLDLPKNELFVVLKYNDSLKIVVNNTDINYIPEYDNDPICFAVSLCDNESSIHVSIPVGRQTFMEKFESIKAISDLGWAIDIYEVGLSAFPKGTAFQDIANSYISYGDSVFQLPSILPKYHITIELHIEKNTTIDNETIVSLTASGIAYLPEIPNTLQGSIIGDVSLIFNSTFNNQTAMLTVTQLPGVPIPFVLPGYSTESSLWSNGAYLKFDYSDRSVPEMDQFFSSVLPPSRHCSADMFVMFSNSHDIETMIMSTACTGLNILDISIPPGILEHKITIVPNVMIRIESNIINNDYQVNEFLKLTQPEFEYAIAVEYYTNGTVTGQIKNAVISILGTVFTTSIDVSDKLTFTTVEGNEIYNIVLENMMIGVFGRSKENEALVLYIASEVTDSSFFDGLNFYMANYIEKENANFKQRLNFLLNSKSPIENLFYLYSDIVSGLHEDVEDASHINTLATQNANTSLLQYEIEVDDLVSQNILELDNILSVCEEKENCTQECVIEKSCNVCDNMMAVAHWGVGLLEEEDSVIAHYKTDVTEKDWRVGYFCRIITNIKSWGRTKYGQICSYKSGYDIVTNSEWISENKDCNISHYKALEIDTYSTPLKKVCYSNDSADCGMYLESSFCLVSDSACRIAQLQMIDSLDDATKQKLQPLKNLIEGSRNLSVAQIKAELYRYKKNFAECRLAYNKYILDSLNNLLPTVHTNYDKLLMDYSYLQKIENMLINSSCEELFLVKRISFDVTINERSPSSFPLNIYFEIPAMNTSSEITVKVDFKSPLTIIKRDIASAVIQKLKVLLEGNRKKRDCEVTEPSYNEHHFEQYCAMIESIKDYLIELNKTFNDVTTSTESHVQYNLLTPNDVVDIDIDFGLLNSYLNSPLSEDKLLELSFNSVEYLELLQALHDVENASANAPNFFKNAKLVSVWIGFNNLHNTIYDRIIDDRKCYGFADCINTLILILHQIIDDYTLNDDIPAVDEHKLQAAKENALKIIDYFNADVDNVWELLEPLYNVVLEVEVNTFWCMKPPILLSYPDPIVYAELGSNVKLICDDGYNVRWLKDGFPLDIENHVLHMNEVSEADEGKYQCLLSNLAGTTLSPVTELFVYNQPYITLSPSNTSTFEGNEDDALFVCNATGYPTPLYYWYHSIDLETWKLVANGTSNEYVVYKPTKSDEGWYKCQASVYKFNDTSEAAFLGVIGASISKILYFVQFSMAIHSTNGIHPLTGAYTQGLNETIINTIKHNETWLYGYIENLTTTVEIENNILHVSFYLSTDYEYSLTKTIADQATEANEHNAELIDTLEKLHSRFHEKCLAFEYTEDFMYAFPHTLVTKEPIYICPDGQELMDNTFICVNCTAGYHSAVVDNIPTCVKCEHGTFNGLVGQAACTLCPEHMSTIETGLLTNETCQDLCPPHTNSSSGFVSAGCQNCSEGYYQLSFGSTFCIPCSPRDKDNETLIQCFVPTRESTPVRNTRNLQLFMTITGLLSTLLVIAVLAVLIVTVIVGIYKWNSKRVKDNMRTREDLNNQRHRIVLPDFDASGHERIVTNPLFRMEENGSIYDHVGENPMYFEVDELTDEHLETSYDTDMNDFPLTAEWEKQRGSKIRELKAVYEKVENKSYSNNGKGNNADGLKQTVPEPTISEDDDSVSGESVFFKEQLNTSDDMPAESKMESKMNFYA